MAKGSKTTTRRTQVKDLPRKEKELTKEDQKRVKGGEAGSGDDTNARGLAIGKGIRTRDT